MRFKIKETRKRFGDTLQSLARKINYDYSNLSKVERGVYTPTVDLLQKIATTYNIEICDLIFPSSVTGKKNLDIEDMELLECYTFTLNGSGAKNRNDLKVFFQTRLYWYYY